MDDETYFALAHHEDELTTRRLNWLLMGQPLLFLAYTSAVTAKQGPHEVLLAEDARLAAMRWIPVAGLVMALGIWVAVWGVVIAHAKLRARRATEPKQAGISDLTTAMGLVAPLVIPPTLALVWAFLIR